VNNKHKAVVRYVGPTNFAEGVWFGLELEREIGA
jgi:dynactin complex subunit